MLEYTSRKEGLVMEDAEFTQALNYFSAIVSYNLSLVVEEFKTIDGINNYSYIIDELLKNASDDSCIDLLDLDISRVYDLSSQILTLLFNEYKSKEFIHEYFERVVVTGETPFDGSVIMVKGKKFITVGKNDKVMSIPTLTHEGTHIIVPYTYTKNSHILDALPILVELITSILLDGMHIGSSNFNNSLIVRISNLKELYFKESLLISQDASERDKYIHAFKRHSFYNYLISFVYATNLLIYYLEDAPKFISTLNDSLKYDKSFYDLLKYYGINFTKNETITNTIKVLKNTP